MLQLFLDYLEEQVQNHSIYVWGAQGQQGEAVTARWIRQRETSTKNANRAIAYWQKQVAAGYGDVLRAFDCSGLGTYFFVTNKLIPTDLSANGLMGKCTRIKQEDLRAGDMVFRVNDAGRAYHVGYVIDDGKTVIEAQGRDAGVVKGALKGWHRYGRPPFFEQVSRVLKLTTPYLRGDDVLALQKALEAKGFSPGQADGIFGRKTQRAVRNFQAASGLTVDGIAGAKTHEKLGLPFYA